MLQKMLAAMKTKAFIFNAVTILICVGTAIIIPKLVKEINTAANTNNPAINTPTDGGTGTDADEMTEWKELKTVMGNPTEGMKLTATLLEVTGGGKFWELTVDRTDDGTQIKSWADIYAEWKTDKTVLDFGGGNFAVYPGGLHTTDGDYCVTVRYTGFQTLSVLLEKTGSSFE